MKEETWHKVEEHLRGLLGFLHKATDGHWLDGASPRLDKIVFEQFGRFIGYIEYLRDERALANGSQSQHCSMIINLFSYCGHVTHHPDRKDLYEALVEIWRGFRNRLHKTAEGTSRLMDLDTQRALGIYKPDWAELIDMAGHLLRRIDEVEGGLRHVAVQEACLVSLFVLLPTMRSGLWRTMQWKPAALNDAGLQRRLNHNCVNYMFYNDKERTFVVQFFRNLKNHFPVTFLIRASEVPRVHDVLHNYIYEHRQALLTTAENRAADDFLFFNATTGRPIDDSAKMKHWFEGVIKQCAREMGHVAAELKRFKCGPHHCRHALYEYVHTYVWVCGLVCVYIVIYIDR